jgi:hypothetical protein
MTTATEKELTMSHSILRNVLIGCVVTRLVMDVWYDILEGLLWPMDEETVKSLLSVSSFNEEECQMDLLSGKVDPRQLDRDAKECWCNYHDDGAQMGNRMPKVFDETVKDLVGFASFGLFGSVYLPEYLHKMMVLCVMLSANREWLKNVVHILLIFMSLVYDPFVAIGIYGIVTLTPTPSKGGTKVD